MKICVTYATNQSLQYSGHKSLISRRRIAKVERPLLHLEKTHVHDESNLLDVRRLYGYLMIRHREVEIAEDCGDSERVKRFIEAWQQETFEFRHEFQTSIIDAHPQTAVHLSNHHDWKYPRRSRRARDVTRREFIDFVLDSGAHFTLRQAAEWVD